MRLSKSETGRLGEELTAYYLVRSGYEILRRNFRIRGGEIDIIAAKDGIIAFVEVRTRDISALAEGAATVNKRKRSLIIGTALEYSYRYPHELQPRFDISEVTVKNGKITKFRYFPGAYDGGADQVL